MPRQPRIKGEDLHYHVILRCNNKEPLFQEHGDFDRLLFMLYEGKRKFCFRLYNYEILNSHVHLMLSNHGDFLIDEIMHDICLKYAKDFNQRHKRSGHFWAHRYRSRIILDDQYGLACLRYQHRNALSAGIVAKPEDWPWSGYSYYMGLPNPLLEFHPSYLALCDEEHRRRQIYKNLVYTSIPSDKISNLLEKGNGKPTCRFNRMVKQVDFLRSNLLENYI